MTRRFPGWQAGRCWTCGPAGLVLLAAVALPACHRDEVTYARRPKPAPESVQASMAGGPAMPMPGNDELAPPPTPSAEQALKWTLPAGWTETHPGGMRYATLKPAAGTPEVSVVVLPGPAGGELANVNRWRGQIGLPPLDEAALGTARQAIAAKAGAISLYDFTGDGERKSRMLAGLLSAHGSTWFIKMVGDADAVAGARGDFVQLLETSRFD